MRRANWVIAVISAVAMTVGGGGMAHAATGISATRDAAARAEVANAASAKVPPPACGDTLFPSSAAGWVIPGIGVNVYSNGADEGYGADCSKKTVYVNGQKTGDEWQCVEFVNRLYLTNGWITTPWSADAGWPFWDYTLKSPTKLVKQLDGSVSYLGPGDIVDIDVSVFNPKTSLMEPDGGHVLIVNDSSDVTSGTVNLVSQNSGDPTHFDPVVSGTISNGRVTVDGGRSGDYFYTTIGVVHAPPAHQTAYVVGDFASTVTAINTGTNKAGTAIQVGGLPEGIAISPDGATAYVANFQSDTIIPINTASNTAGKAIPVSGGPQGIAITPDGKTLYVTDLSDDTVTPVDLATRTTETPISVGGSPSGIAITPNGKTAYVANFDSGTVTPITLATGAPQTPIHVGNQPDDVAITPNGSTVYVSNSGSGTVTPINTATNTAGKAITVGSDPQGIAITPNGATAYVAANTGVVPINTSTDAAGKAISTGDDETPVAIAITSNGATAYVANFPTEGGTGQGTQNVTPINMATNKAGTAIPANTGGAIALS